MSSKEKDRESEARLMGLATMIKDIYIPGMENKAEIKMHMKKFMQQIHSSI